MSDTDINALIAEVEELDGIATPDPWVHTVMSIPDDDEPAHNVVLSRDEAGKALRDTFTLSECDAELIAIFRTAAPILAAECKRLKADNARLEDENECGLNISGSFFEALKLLKLQSINVNDPGQHVADLITECKRLKHTVETKIPTLEAAMVLQGETIAKQAEALKVATEALKICLTPDERTDPAREALARVREIMGEKDDPA